MLVKLGVDISRLNREIRRTLNAVDEIYKSIDDSEAVITSTYEGYHSPGSLHYANNAYDVRYPKKITIAEMIASIKATLGDKFDVVLSDGCIHIEYDPKD